MFERSSNNKGVKLTRRAPWLHSVGQQRKPSHPPRTERSMSLLTLAPRHVPVLLVLLCLFLITSASHTSADACASCLNGGKLLMPNNIFGFCRCKCVNAYVGPRCQFAKRKRTSLSPLGLGWGGQLYDASSSPMDDEDAVREMLRVQDEAMLKLIFQQLYGSQRLSSFSEDQEDRRR